MALRPSGLCRFAPSLRSNSGLTIVMYHSISSTADPYTVSPPAFRRQLTFIANTYAVVRLRDIREHLARDDGRKVVITFDDSFRDFLESAHPVLEELSIPSTLFVPTGHIGGWNSWDRDTPGMVPKRIMDMDELRQVCSTRLVDVGSHTVDHRSMRRLSLNEMRSQAVSSRRWLEDTFGVPVDMFSYPYGQRDDFSPLTTKVLAQAGYDIAVTTCWGVRSSLGNLLTLRRISFTEHDDQSSIRGKIDGKYDWIGMKESLGYAWRSRANALRPAGDREKWTQHGR